MRQYPWTCRPELRLGPYVNWWKSFNTVARLPTAHYIFPWNLLSSRETQAFCRTRVAWCIPPARKLICPGDYAPYFIMRRYIYVLPPGRKPSPWYQNKDDRTTPSPSLFSLFFFFPLSFFIHALFPSLWLLPFESLRVCKSARSIVTLDEFTLFFTRDIYFEKGKGYGQATKQRAILFYLRFSFLGKFQVLPLRIVTDYYDVILTGQWKIKMYEFSWMNIFNYARICLQNIWSMRIEEKQIWNICDVAGNIG